MYTVRPLQSMTSTLTSPTMFSRSPKFQLFGLVQPRRATALREHLFVYHRTDYMLIGP